MTRLAILLILTMFCLATISTSSKSYQTIQTGNKDNKDTSSKADVVFNNGNIYTVSDKQPKAEAIAVKNGKIIFVGSNQEAKIYINPNTQVIDLKGNTVVPGMTDSHYHLSGVGDREVMLNLEGVASLSDMLAKLKAEVDKTPPGKWIVGRGWIETFWQPPVFPTSEDLDKVSPNNPVFLDRADGHGAIVNSQALKIAGIDKNTANPFGGEIMRDKESAKATGMLLDSAQLLVTKHIPEQTETDKLESLAIGAKRSVELGWCQIQNAGSTYQEIDRLKKLYKENKIKLRVYNAVYGPGIEAGRLLKEGPIMREFGDRFTVRTIKVSFDGALGSKGAALLEPYADHNSSGFLTQKEGDLIPMFNEALKKGIQVETHAIGDRANREILNIYEKCFQTIPNSQRKVVEPRWRIEHAQIVHPTDIPRFAKLGVIPSMQPSHAISDLHFAPRRVGIERLKGAYAWQSFLKTGVVIAAGSDAPVERGEPMIEFYAAVARKDLKGFSGEGWHLEEAVSREDGLKMFTIWAAYAAFEEDIKGSIVIGKLADLTVLSADIMKIPVAEIPKTKCVMTVIGGEVVYKSSLLN